MGLDSLAEYIGMLSPLAVGMLVVPLADQRGLPLWLREWYRNGPVTPIGAKQHFTYSEKALETGRWWTLFTYVLHHQNVDHLAGNLLGLLLFGRPVHEKLHALGFYATFFSGSVISALDLTTKRFQISTAIGVMLGNPFPRELAWVVQPGCLSGQGVPRAVHFAVCRLQGRECRGSGSRDARLCPGSDRAVFSLRDTQAHPLLVTCPGVPNMCSVLHHGRVCMCRLGEAGVYPFRPKQQERRLPVVSRMEWFNALLQVLCGVADATDRARSRHRPRRPR